MKRCGMQFAHEFAARIFGGKMPKDIIVINPWGYSLEIESTYMLLRFERTQV
jgi:hypothetical protein